MAGEGGKGGRVGKPVGEPNVHPDKKAMERIRGKPKGLPDRHKTRKETAKNGSQTPGVPFVILLCREFLLMSLRRREAQGASDSGRFARIFGHHLRPLTGRSMVLAYNSKYDSTHLRCGKYRLPDHSAKRRPMTLGRTSFLSVEWQANLPQMLM